MSLDNVYVKGEITIYSERPFCDSCRDPVFKQFNKIFPNAIVTIGSDGINVD
ncbi:deaminase domain-containing protein [Flavobacterium sp.]|uniref:deaminase domain-containing protein n=1 Tax=Flavobacterium sp. TaxID=239 RepID=UPI003A91E645